MKDLVAFVASALVDLPGQVEVVEVERDDTVVTELRVAKTDLGKVIGKQGRTAKAIRTVLAVAAQRQGKKVKLEIAD